MLENGRISIRQLILLFITSRIVLNLTYFPASKSPPLNQDLWLSQLLSIPITILLAVPLMVLAARYPQQTLIQYSRTIAGKYAGNVVAVLYLWFFLHIGAITLRQFSGFMVTTQMPHTPMIIFTIGIIIVSAYAARNGIEVICRSNEVIFPILIFSFLFFVALIAKDLDLHMLTPVLEEGIIPVLDGGFSTAARYVELVWVAMIFPFIKDPSKATRGINFAILISGLQFVISAILVTTQYGYPLIEKFSFPILEVVRAITVADFIERVESLVTIIWVLGMFVRIAIIHYAFSLGSAQLLNLNNYRPLVLPTGTIMAAMSLFIFTNVQELLNFLKPSIFTPYALVFILIIPLMLLIIDSVKTKAANKGKIKGN